MLNLEINKIFALIIGVVALYSGYVIQTGVQEVYANWLSFFGQDNTVYPLLITFLYAAVPFGFLSIATLVYLNNRSLIILPLLLIGWFFFVSYTVYLILFLVLVWWVRLSYE